MYMKIEIISSIILIASLYYYHRSDIVHWQLGQADGLKLKFIIVQLKEATRKYPKLHFLSIQIIYDVKVSCHVSLIA